MKSSHHNNTQLIQTIKSFASASYQKRRKNEFLLLSHFPLSCSLYKQPAAMSNCTAAVKHEVFQPTTIS
jgi:hypothetical protein